MLSVSMIVRNEEKYLEECLESVKPIADEIIIADTGSTDNTIKIAEKYGAKVFHFDWINDFAAARNFSLSKCAGDWVLYIDADERIDQGSLKEIDRIKKTSDKIGFFCTVKSHDGEGNRDNSMRYVRLFRRVEGAEFTGRVHEQISGALQKAGVKLVNSSILINHLGYNLGDEGRKEKARRNLELLLEEYGSSQTGYLAFQLANTHFILENNAESKKFFEIAANSGDLSKNLKALSYSYLALMEHKELNSDKALNYIEKSISLNSEQPFSYFLSSKIQFQKGLIEKAEEFCKKALLMNKKSTPAAGQEMHIFMQDEEIAGFGLYIAVQNKRGDLKFFLNEYRNCIRKREKEFGERIVTIVTKLISKEGIEKKDEMLLIDSLNGYNSFFFYLLLENSLSTLTFDFVSNLYTRFRGEKATVNFYSRYQFEKGNIKEAIGVLEENYNVIKDDPPSLLYLISYYMTEGMLEKAEEEASAMEEKFASMSQVTHVVRNIKEKIFLLKKS